MVLLSNTFSSVEDKAHHLWQQYLADNKEFCLLSPTDFDVDDERRVVVIAARQSSCCSRKEDNITRLMIDIGSTAPHATTNQGSFKKKFYRCSLLHNVVSRNYHNEIVPRCVPWDRTADVECTYHPLQLEKWQPAAIRLPFRKHLTFYKDLRDTYRRGITRTVL